MDRAFVADDHAWMRRRAGARPVRPDDGIARQNPAPPVVAAHIDALPGADLGQGWHGEDGDKGRYQAQHGDDLADGHGVPGRGGVLT